jgi:hypothetical protein
MRPTRKFFALFAGLVSGTLIILMIARIEARNSRKRLLKTVDVFAEPLGERINEFFDIIAVTFDLVKEAVTGLTGYRKTKSDQGAIGLKTTPGRYVRAKV